MFPIKRQYEIYQDDYWTMDNGQGRYFRVQFKDQLLMGG